MVVSAVLNAFNSIYQHITSNNGQTAILLYATIVYTWHFNEKVSYPTRTLCCRSTKTGAVYIDDSKSDFILFHIFRFPFYSAILLLSPDTKYVWSCMLCDRKPNINHELLTTLNFHAGFYAKMASLTELTWLNKKKKTSQFHFAYFDIAKQFDHITCYCRLNHFINSETEGP